MVRLLMSLAVIVITATETRAQQGVDYLLRQAIPTSPATAPDQLQLPTAWVQALNDASARAEKVNQEIGGCLTFSVLPTADTARREAAIRVLGSKAEETGAAVDGLQRLALAAREATGPLARGIEAGDEVSNRASCASGETYFHTHPPFLAPDEWSFIPSGTDAMYTLLNVTEESVLHQEIRLVRARSGISLVLPTLLSTDTTSIAALFEAPRFAFRWEKQETFLRQIHTAKELAQMISALLFDCDQEAPDRGAACNINQLAALLTTAGFAFYTGGTDGALRRVHPTRPAPLKITTQKNQRIVSANLMRNLVTGRAPASLQEFLQPPLWAEMVTPSMRAAHTHFAPMFARAGFTFSDETLVRAQHQPDVHFHDLMVFPSVSALDMFSAKLDGKGKHLPISFVPCSSINLDGDTWTTYAIAERWLPAGAKRSDQLLPYEGGRTGAVLFSKQQNRVLAATYGRVQGGQVLFEGEWPSAGGVTWKGRFTINSKDACSFQPVGAGSGKSVDKKTGATSILDGSMADKHFTGTFTLSNGTIKRVENLMIY